MPSIGKRLNHFQRSIVFGVPHLSNREKGLAFFSHCNKPPSPPPPIPPTTPPFSIIPPPPPPPPPLPPHVYFLDLVVLVTSVSVVLERVGVDAVVLEREVVPTTCVQADGADFWAGLSSEMGPFGKIRPLIRYGSFKGDEYLLAFVLEVGFADGIDFVDLVLVFAWLKKGVAGYGLEKECVGQLDSMLMIPMRPPDPELANVDWFICSLGPETWPQTTSGNLYRLPTILSSHEAQYEALRDLVFCPPTDGLYLDRSTVAIDAWGCLPFIGSGNGIDGCTVLVSEDLKPSYLVLFPSLNV